VIAIMYEANYGLRYIYTDGRALPKQGSGVAVLVRLLRGKVGRRHARGGDEQFEGRRDRAVDGWLDVRGSPTVKGPSSSSAFAGPPTANWKSTSPSTIEAYTKPFTVRINQQISPTRRLSSSSATRTSSSGGA